MAMTITISDEREKRICEYAQELEDLVARKRARFDEVYSDDYNAFDAAFDRDQATADLLNAVNESAGFAKALLHIGIYCYHSGVNADGPMKLYKAE